MGEEKKLKPSQTSVQQKVWFWPAVYTAIAVIMISVIAGYSVITSKDPETAGDSANLTVPGSTNAGTAIATNSQSESMKYPFKEALVNDVQVLQDFYDVNADAKSQENALLVFNQIFTTSKGLSLSVKGEAFEVLAAMSGEIQEVKTDVFTGGEITIVHANGYTTKYSSVADILVKEGDVVAQGEQIATTIQNESNPNAGIHLHFQILKDGGLIDPKSLLAF